MSDVAICPCGKVCFTTERAALKNGRDLSRRTRSGASSFAYLCEMSGRWHKTTQSPRNRRLRRKRAAQHIGRFVEIEVPSDIVASEREKLAQERSEEAPEPSSTGEEKK